MADGSRAVQSQIATLNFDFESMINRLLSGSLSSSTRKHGGGGTPIQHGVRPSTAAMVVPFKLNPKIFSDSTGSSIMLECRVFNETALDVKHCYNALARIFVLFFGCTPRNGESTTTDAAGIGSKEATTTFFYITKAFQSKDLYLRRLLYLAIKCLAPYANDILMVISSITQDISSRADPVFRANSIRVLSRVIDISMLQSVERFVKQPLLEGFPILSSASLVSCIYWLKKSENTVHYEPIRRWISSIVPADWIPPEGMCRFHALILGYILRQQDKGSLKKLLSTYSSFLRDESASNSSMALSVLFIQICSKINLGDAEFLPSWGSLLVATTGKEMVALEVCTLIGNSSIPSSEEDKRAAIQLAIGLLSSSSSIIRYTAIKSLLLFTSTRPDLLAKCHQDIEPLIGDPNRSVAIVAVTILLKIGNESSIDRVVPHLKTSLSDMPESLKKSVLEAMSSLAIQFPAKASNIAGFFSLRLREEGDHMLKRLLISSIDDIIIAVPSVADEILPILCEFIEDCEFSDIACDVLHIIGKEGPKSNDPTVIIRHIFNRLLLEVSTVRMAALGALIKFGTELDSCRELVIRLIRQRGLKDEDAEIRDRSFIFLNSLDTVKKPETLGYIFNDQIVDLDVLEEKASSFISEKIACLDLENLDSTRYSIIDNIKNLAKSSQGPKSLPMMGQLLSSDQASSLQPLDKIHLYIETLYGPDFTKPEAIIHQSSSIQLTEQDTEYIVVLKKYLLRSMLVLHFSCLNTVPHIQLEGLKILINFPRSMSEKFHIKSSSIALLEGSAADSSLSQDLFYFILLNEDRPLDVPLGSFATTMSFSMREVDFTTGELAPFASPDEYKLVDVDILPSDYSSPKVVKTNFDGAFDTLSPASEKKLVFQINSFPGTLESLINKIFSTVGGSLSTAPGSTETGRVAPFRISGHWLNRYIFLIRGRVASLGTGSSYAVELILRTEMPSPALSDLLLSAL